MPVVSEQARRGLQPRLIPLKRKGRPPKVTPEHRIQIMYFQEMGVPASIIADRHIKDLSPVTVWRVIRQEQEKRNGQFQKSTISKLAEPARSTSDVPTVDHGFEIGHYQPAMQSSFNGGKGTPIEAAVLNYVIKTTATGNLSPQEKAKRFYELRNTLGPLQKDKDPRLHKIREQLTMRMQEISGFHGDSDKDQQFGDLDQLARLLIRIYKNLRGAKYNPTKLVDAFLTVCLGEKARAVIEREEKHLQCPRCRKPRSYIVSNQTGDCQCVKCGRIIPHDKAKLQIKINKIEAKYLRTVERFLGSSVVEVASAQ